MDHNSHRTLAQLATGIGLVLGATALAIAPEPADEQATGRSAAIPAAATLPILDFGACPALPAGAVPDRCRCEVPVAPGEFRPGGIVVPIHPMTSTHAEGRLPAGTTAGGLDTTLAPSGPLLPKDRSIGTAEHRSD